MSLGAGHRDGHRAAWRAGIALVEVVFATATVGTLTVAALSLAGAAAHQRANLTDQTLAVLLAHELAEEIASKPVTEPAGNEEETDSIMGFINGMLSGPQQVQSVTTSPSTTSGRTSFDAVRDFSGLEDSPPHRSDGTPITGAEHLSRRVEAVEVAPGNPGGPASGGSGLWRVTVTVSRGQLELTRVVVLRSEAASEVLN